ncbi:MAG: TIGR03643 family protein [Bacteroidia bacterium]
MREFTAIEIDRIIEMAWEDRTPFEAIFVQFDLREDDIKAIMKRELHPNNWRKWRARVGGRKTKHQALRNDDVNRFKCSMQKSTGNRISKR